MYLAQRRGDNRDGSDAGQHGDFRGLWLGLGCRLGLSGGRHDRSVLAMGEWREGM